MLQNERSIPQPLRDRSIPQPSRGEGAPAVLRAALTTFGHHGYEGASVRQIAGAAGVTVSVIYHHYGNKQELLFTILNRVTEDLAATVQSALVAADSAPETRLQAAVEAFVCFYIDRQAECRVLNTEMRSLTSKNYHRHLELRRQLQAIFDGLMLACAPTGESKPQHSLRQVEIDARAVVVMCRDVVNWYRPGGHMSREAVARHYAEVSMTLASRSYQAPPCVT